MSNKTPDEIHAEEAKMRSLFTAIGQFMFEFSQLEYIIRCALAEALEFPADDNAQFDIVTSPMILRPYAM